VKEVKRLREMAEPPVERDERSDTCSVGMGRQVELLLRESNAKGRTMHSEVILPRRVIPQPSPHVVAGGDCGGCCISGVLGISINQAYSLQDKDCRRKDAQDAPVPFGWHDMGFALKNGGWCGNTLTDTVIDEIPMWPGWVHKSQLTKGFLGWQYHLPWWHYVRMGLLGGFYGICQVSLDPKGPLGSHDHWVLICGCREVETPIEAMPGARRIDQHILVSCSARHPQGEWRDASKFMIDHGGYNVILVRPSDAKVRE